MCEINKLENVSFIKIDVEGMEIEVLNGAKNLIDRNRSSIFVEVNEKKYVEKNLSFLPIIEKYNKSNRKFYLENLIKREFVQVSAKEVGKKIKFSKNNFNLLIV